MIYDAKRALELLRIGSGSPRATFREGQEEAIRALVEDRGRLLVVQKTGWGKSFVYFIAARLLREAGAGPALLVSPLLALMRNQLAAAERMGVRAATINSSNRDDWRQVEDDLVADRVDILLVSPERFGNEAFMTGVLAGISSRIGMLVVDEAHCISDWGHDFRPHYRRIEHLIRTLPRNLRVLATTATANDRVMADLEKGLGPDLSVSRGDLNRPSLALQTIRLPGQADRLAWLAAQLPKLPGSGIIYVLTVRDASLVADWLQSRGLAVAAYTGDTGDGRVELENALLNNDVKALVATSALGMGFDKPDLAFVIHYQAPGSVVHYYQQVGRAGRALDGAYGVLLSGREETTITDFFIESAFPTKDEVHSIIRCLDSAPEGLSLPDLNVRLNLQNGRIQKALDLLSLESPAPVVKQGARWQLTAAVLDHSFWDRAERLTNLRRSEQHEMQKYVALEDGHMEFLIRSLDGDPSGVTNAPLPPLPTTAPPGLAQAALTFLRRTDLPIEPRKKWPHLGLPTYGVRGTIAADHRAGTGRALCTWGDAGWGALVRDGKYEVGRFDDALVTASVDAVGRWAPDPAPVWVTCVPSLRRPALMPDFSRRLARALGLPFVHSIVKTVERPEQKLMANGAQKSLNLDGAFELGPHDIPTGPVLLIDDMVDSRWTFTVATWLLRQAGCREVWPFALAAAGGRE